MNMCICRLTLTATFGSTFLFVASAFATPVEHADANPYTDASALLGPSRLPSVGSEGLAGSAWLDFDNDGDQDLFQPGSFARRYASNCYACLYSLGHLALQGIDPGFCRTVSQ